MKPRAKRDPAERFWEKVCPEPTTGCWLWTAAGAGYGYGRFRTGGVGAPYVNAHRFAWELAHGPIPDGLWALHRCDTPACVNPAHLFLGTALENNRDKVAKGRARGNEGRHACGDRNGARLHPERLARGERNGAYTRPERRRRGEENGFAKLTADAVRDMRARYRAGTATRMQLAREYGIAKGNVGFILRGETWRHVS